MTLSGHLFHRIYNKHSLGTCSGKNYSEETPETCSVLNCDKVHFSSGHCLLSRKLGLVLTKRISIRIDT